MSEFLEGVFKRLLVINSFSHSITNEAISITYEQENSSGVDPIESSNIGH